MKSALLALVATLGLATSSEACHSVAAVGVCQSHAAVAVTAVPVVPFAVQSHAVVVPQVAVQSVVVPQAVVVQKQVVVQQQAKIRIRSGYGIRSRSVIRVR